MWLLNSQWPLEVGSEGAAFIRLGFDGSGVKGIGVSEPCPELVYDSPLSDASLGTFGIGLSGQSPRVICFGGAANGGGEICSSTIDCSIVDGTSILTSVS